MRVNQEHCPKIEELINCYGDGKDGSAPTEACWKDLAERGNTPITLLNFFKFNDRVTLPSGESVTGIEAFQNYAAVSMPAMAKAGGSFLHMGPHEGMFCGIDEAWDLIVVGTYPNTDALFALVSNPDYMQAYGYRKLACKKQKVFISGSAA